MADTAAAIAKLKKQSEGSKDPLTLACVNYLTTFLEQEPNFAEKIVNDKKSLKEMRNYIYSEARKLTSDNCSAGEIAAGADPGKREAAPLRKNLR